MKFRIAPLLVVLLLPLVMGFSKKPTYILSFHAQAQETDPKKTMFPINIEGRQMLFKLVPEVSQQNIIAFHPFDSDVGGKGVAVQFDFRGTGAVEILTRMRRGQVLLAMVDGKPVDYLIIDQVISNGMLTIWRNVPEPVIAAMDKKLPRIKPGGPPSMNENMEMKPTTKTDKKRFWARSRLSDKKKSKSGEEEKPPEIPSLNAPQAPTANSIPLEGAPAAPQGPANPAAPAPPSLLPPRANPILEPSLPKP